MIVPRIPAETDSVGQHYDELDEFYREVWGEHVHHGFWKTGRETPGQAVEQLVHLVAKCAGITAGTHVCDVGCGYGGTSRFLVNEYQAEVIGLTVSTAQFQYASELTAGQDNPSFLLCPWEKNDFDSESFDAIVSIECVSHVPDKLEFYRQIYRVLRPGGTAVVIAWLANPKAGRWTTEHLLLPICREGRLPGMATADEYAEMISRAGLKLEAYKELSRKVRKTWWICARRLLWKLATKRKYRNALLDRNKSNRIFALTLLRIIAAYQTGAMQYGVFQISKPRNVD
jgi:tocopherol O-methyltransferase